MMDNKYIEAVAKLAHQAFQKKEVPVGAIVIDSQGNIIGKGYNASHLKKDATQHAEIKALQNAYKKIGDWRLDNCTMVVNLEPCLMCLGAIANSRIKKVIYFLADPAFGSAESKLTKLQLKKLFPKLEVAKSPDKGETHKLLQEFFKNLRNK